MLVSGWVNSEIRLPVINNEHLSQMYEAEELELQYIKHQIARYMRYPLALPPFAGPPPETKCDIYIFRGIE